MDQVFVRYGFSDEQLASLETVYAPGVAADKVFVISGAGSGMGRAMSYLFARLGADVVLAGRKEEPLRETERGIAGFGGRTLVIPTNIRDADQVANLMDKAWETLGRVDVLINNAGGQFPQPALDYSVKGWNAVIDTNLNGTWTMMQAAARRWRDHGQGGNIVNIVANIDRGLPGCAHTCAARAGVIYLSKTVAVEWAPLGIRVNCVAPGTIATDGLNVYSEAARNFFLRASNPMKTAGDAHDIAQAAAYLALSSGKFVTGEVIQVDGGQRMWGSTFTIPIPDYYKTGT